MSGWPLLGVVMSGCGYEWVAIGGCGYEWMAIVGCGYEWVAIVGCGYEWMVFSGCGYYHIFILRTSMDVQFLWIITLVRYQSDVLLDVPMKGNSCRD